MLEPEAKKAVDHLAAIPKAERGPLVTSKAGFADGYGAIAMADLIAYARERDVEIAWVDTEDGD